MTVPRLGLPVEASQPQLLSDLEDFEVKFEVTACDLISQSESESETVTANHSCPAMPAARTKNLIGEWCSLLLKITYRPFLFSVADVEVVDVSPTTFTVNRSVENVEITVTVATGGLATLRGYSAEWNVSPTLTVYLDNGMHIQQSLGVEFFSNLNFLQTQRIHSQIFVHCPPVNGFVVSMVRH